MCRKKDTLVEFFSFAWIFFRFSLIRLLSLWLYFTDKTEYILVICYIYYTHICYIVNLVRTESIV